MKSEMQVKISGKRCGRMVVIEIVDNGAGMDGEITLEKLREKIINYEKYDLRGLMMVYSKLKLFFEEDFEFIVESEQGKGTSVTIIYSE